MSGADADDAWRRYAAAREYLDVELVRPTKRRVDPEGKARAARAFLAALGDPQRAWPAVQVAGTSGKGSVATLIALGLDAAGLRAGLHVSPYLQAFTEKVGVAGRYCDARALARAVDRVRPVADPLRADPDLPASVHGLAGLGSVLLTFAAEGLDVAVVESGIGARFDLVQGLRRALSVVTDLGLDHQDVLGPTLEAIAWHKAGVLERGVPAVAVVGPAWPVLAAEAARLGADLTPVDPDLVCTPLGPAPEGGERARLRLPRLGEVEVRLPTIGYQRRNAAVAAAALDRLAGEGWPVRAEHLVQGFARLRFPGRLEAMPGDARVLLDGAHNGQKAEALRRAFAEAHGPAARAVVVLGSTGARDPRDVLRALAPITARVVATAPRLVGKDVTSPEDLARLARAEGLDALAEQDPRRALEAALDLAGGRPVVVSGSLYLVGQVRERWFTTRDVVLQRTSWPVPGV